MIKKILHPLLAILLISGLAWAKAPSRTWDIQNINVTCLYLGKNIANCYVVSSSNKDAYVIDPGGNAPAIIEYLKAHDLNVKGYLITHGHNDHIRALPQLHKERPASTGIHASDIPLYRKRKGNAGPFDLFFKNGQTYGTKDLPFTIIHSPGHSPGGVCFYFKQAGVLFTGDTLFKNGKGRTDLDGGSAVELQASLKKLAKLPPRTVVFPGHGAMTLRSKELPSKE